MILGSYVLPNVTIIGPIKCRPWGAKNSKSHPE